MQTHSPRGNALYTMLPQRWPALSRYWWAPDQIDVSQFIILWPAPLYCVSYLMVAPVITHQSLHRAVKCQLQTAPVHTSEPEWSCQSGSVPPSTSDSWVWADLNLTAKYRRTHPQRECASKVIKAVLRSEGKRAKRKFRCPHMNYVSYSFKCFHPASTEDSW